jgi:hypothetical protein
LVSSQLSIILTCDEFAAKFWKNRRCAATNRHLLENPTPKNSRTDFYMTWKVESFVHKTDLDLVCLKYLRREYMKQKVWNYSAFLAMLALSSSAMAATPEELCSHLSGTTQEICIKAIKANHSGGQASEPSTPAKPPKKVDPPKPPKVEPQPPVVVKPPKVEPQQPPKADPPKPPKVDPPVVQIDPPAQSGSYTGPERTIVKSASANQKMFSEYCGNVKADSAEPPQPNYSNSDVLKAAKRISKVAPLNIYYYGDLKRIYKAGSPMTPEIEAKGITENGHLFIVQTCGEFRDRAEMIQAKINWVNDMVLLGSDAQGPIDPKSENVWSQVSGHSYMPYLNISVSVYNARKSAAAANSILDLHPQAQRAADGTSICETKYVLSEYVAAGKSFSSLAEFDAGYQAYQSKCLASDKEYYYDFRGDSNFKQYSPESNAMIWQAISIARNCASSTKSNGKSDKITDQVCQDYFSAPFKARYNAARSGLGAWLLYTNAEKAGFQNQGLNVTVFPSFDIKNLGVVPFQMQLSDGTKTNSQIELKDGTLGFNDMFKLGTSSANTSEAFERLRDAVNRHTNWYASAFDDGLGSDKSKKDQAYSPFVASSYEMSASNQFTECGITVSCQGDGRKAWMLVFKVKKSNWYNTESLLAKKPINFDRMWIDETTFGTDHLADSERAWDRLGTALEDELATILYLHNLEAGSGRPVANDKLD